MSDLNNQARAFLNVAELDSFVRASERMFVTEMADYGLWMKLQGSNDLCMPFTQTSCGILRHRTWRLKGCGMLPVDCLTWDLHHEGPPYLGNMISTYRRFPWQNLTRADLELVGPLPVHLRVD